MLTVIDMYRFPAWYPEESFAIVYRIMKLLLDQSPSRTAASGVWLSVTADSRTPTGILVRLLGSLRKSYKRCDRFS